MAAPVPMTKLEAVNLMLDDIGSRPTTSLSAPTRRDVVRAVSAIDAVTRSVQQKGYWFNTEIISVSINGSNQYAVPTNVHHVEVLSGGPTTGANGTPFLVVRNALLYDVVNGTNTFAGGADVKLVVQRYIDFEELPNSAREYIYAAASIRNQSRALGSNSIDEDLKEQARQALALLNEEDLDAQNFDTTYSLHFIDMMHRR